MSGRERCAVLFTLFGAARVIDVAERDLALA
jgi:hypothetical protein